MKKRIYFIIILVAVLISAKGQEALSDSILFVSPTRVTLDKEERVAIVNVTNQSDIIRAYNVEMNDLKMTADGITTPAEDGFKYSLKKMKST